MSIALNHVSQHWEYKKSVYKIKLSFLITPPIFTFFLPRVRKIWRLLRTKNLIGHFG